MKRLLFINALLIFSYLSLHAQGGKKKGAAAGGATTSSASPTPSSPAGASSPAANTGAQQTGYVYRLRKNYHIMYGTEKDTSYTVNRESTVLPAKFLSGPL